MPTSTGTGKAYIREILSKHPAKKVLDIGAGAGNLHKRYHRNGEEWTAVEIWEPYIEEYKLKEKYKTIIVRDARTMDFGENTYDVAFAGDVLEHMEPHEAAELLSKLRKAAPLVIVSIPIGYYPQGEWGGNPYERHVKDDWQVQDVMHILGHTDEFSLTPPVGTFIYRRSNKDMPLKIAVYGISKNEAQFVDTFMKSAMDADCVIIGDTGSEDGTQDLLRGRGAIVHDIYISPWRFDLARNAVLALIPRDIDVCISLDMDEQLEPGWREEIERLWVRGHTTRLRHKFDWGSGLVFDYEKTHSRNGYHWHHPCHEYPRPDPRFVEKQVTSAMLMVTHHPDDTKSRSSYIDPLWASVQEDPHCPRNAFYYARELTFNARWDEAIEALKKYMAMPGPLWPHEVSYAMRLMGDSYMAKGQVANGLQWYRKACAETPSAREPWFSLAAACNKLQQWPEMFGATSKALDIKTRELVYTINVAAWGAQMHDYHAIAAYKLGLNAVALEHGLIACELSPTDQRLQANLKFYREAPK